MVREAAPQVLPARQRPHHVQVLRLLERLPEAWKALSLQAECGTVVLYAIKILYSIKHPTSQADRALIVNLHNDLRRKVAHGDAPGKQPPASDMYELKWSWELAYIAMQWAETCPSGHDENANVIKRVIEQTIMSLTEFARGYPGTISQ